MGAKESIHPVTERRLTRSEIEYMLAHILRMAELFLTAKSTLQLKYFYPDESDLKCIWEAALAIEKEKKLATICDPSNTAQTFNNLWTDLAARFTKEPELISPDQYEYVLSKDQFEPGLLQRIYNLTEKELDRDRAVKYLQRFLQERAAFDPLRRKMIAAGDGIIVNYPELLQQYRDAYVSISATSSDPVESGAPEGWVPTKMNKFPTNIPWVDKFLKGGHAGGETYGVLGAFASGKTSMAVMLLSQGALWQQQHAEDLTNSTGIQHYPKDCYLFHYEATRDEIRIRLWSSVCQIDHEVIEEFDMNNLSSIEHGFDSLKPYEREMYKTQRDLSAVSDAVFLGEKERLAKFQPLLRINMWNIDMSGVPEAPKRGTGYVPEIRQIIENHQRKLEERDGRKHEVGLVAIDYAGIACRRHMTENEIAFENNMRFYVSGFPDACRRDIAVMFNCPVWIFHQLSGSANDRTYQAKQRYSDAAESKSFAENLTFCFALGTKDEVSNQLLFTCSKARRANIGDPPVLFLQGAFYTLVESKTHVYSRKLNKIVTKEVFEKSNTKAMPTRQHQVDRGFTSNHGGANLGLTKDYD